jgi:hypothetical protein
MRNDVEPWPGDWGRRMRYQSMSNTAKRIGELALTASTGGTDE